MASLARSISNSAQMLALRLGLTAPPYSRRNTVIIETLRRRSGKVRRTPVGCLDEEGKIIVVASMAGARTMCSRRSLARGASGSHRGRWRAARLRLLADAPEPYSG